jgi:hypothetical protein
MRKFDTLAMFTTVLSVWLGVWGPTNTTTWKDWQPLMASVIAIGGATIVYRGARLAYQASMVKFDFDRATLLEARKRTDLGIFLRLEFALNVLRHKAETLKKIIPLGLNMDADTRLEAKWFVIKEPDALIESWRSLESFPASIATALSGIRGHLYDLENFYEAVGEIAWEVKAYGSPPPELVRIRRSVDQLASFSEMARNDLAKVITAIQK